MSDNKFKVGDMVHLKTLEEHIEYLESIGYKKLLTSNTEYIRYENLAADSTVHVYPDRIRSMTGVVGTITRIESTTRCPIVVSFHSITMEVGVNEWQIKKAPQHINIME